MKILHIGNAAGISVPLWANHSVAQGHEVHIYSPIPAEIKGIIMHHMTTTGSPSYNNLARLVQLGRLCQKLQPDIVHAHYLTKYAALGAMAKKAKLIRCPLIVQVWGSDVFVEAEQDKDARRRVQLSLEMADAVVVTIESTKEFLMERYATGDIRVIQMGVDLDVFTMRQFPEGNIKPFTIFSPRGYSPHYRQRNIEDAICLLVGKNYDIDFKPSPQPEGVSKEIMADWYHDSNCMVSIPLSDQFSSCLQEAMACGCVPIVCDLPAYHQYLTHGVNARYVSHDATPEDIAKEIIWCMEHPEERVEYASRNREIAVEHFNWGKCIRDMDNLYQELAR